MFRTLCNPGIFKAPGDSEPRNIQNTTRIQNPVTYLRWRVLWKKTSMLACFFCKNTYVGVRYVKTSVFSEKNIEVGVFCETNIYVRVFCGKTCTFACFVKKNLRWHVL